MKNFAPLLFALCLAAAGCCKKRTVTCIDEQYNLYFVGFTPNELDSIIIKWYNKENAFNSPVATAVYRFSVSATFQDTLALSSASPKVSGTTAEFVSNYDVEVYIPSLQKTYRISEVQDQGNNTSVVTTCWNTKVATICINELRSFKLDGNPMNFGDSKSVYLAK